MRRNALVLIVSGALAVTASAEPFTLTVENLGPQPLSPVFFAASNINFNIFSIGSMTSAALEDIAEEGDATLMTQIAAMAGSDVASYGVLGATPLAPGEERSFEFSADADRRYFSFASMLGLTNDGFIGESVNTMAIDMYVGETPMGFTYTVFGSRSWDAGTELNTQDATDLVAFGGTGSPNEMIGMTHVRVHGGIIAGIGDSWTELPNWNFATPLARLEVTPTPEPATILALSLGAVALWSRKRKNTT
jgi:hypothetical protein